LKTIQRQNPDAVFLAGLNMKSLLNKWVGDNEVQEAGWYQQYKLDDDVEIFFLPARHSSRRSINDVNERLWGAFVIRNKEKTIYYGGDSGYGSHYKEAGILFPNISVAMIGVGAYSPRWFMSPNHQDPQKAVQAFNDTRAKMMIPFHYGTFDMADEPLSEPEAILSTLAEENRVKQHLKIVKIGEAVILD
jgi:L-ascorbate metabolism protein UlaG (beta-lactamase superfamily)